jgi:hypothetical protein
MRALALLLVLAWPLAAQEPDRWRISNAALVSATDMHRAIAQITADCLDMTPALPNAWIVADSIARGADRVTILWVSDDRWLVMRRDLWLDPHTISIAVVVYLYDGNPPDGAERCIMRAKPEVVVGVRA